MIKLWKTLEFWKIVWTPAPWESRIINLQSFPDFLPETWDVLKNKYSTQYSSKSIAFGAVKDKVDKDKRFLVSDWIIIMKLSLEKTTLWINFILHLSMNFTVHLVHHRMVWKIGDYLLRAAGVGVLEAIARISVMMLAIHRNCALLRLLQTYLRWRRGSWGSFVKGRR